MATTLAELVADLKFNSQVQTSEMFADPSDYERVVIRAGKKHNSSYVISSTACTVPSREHDALVILAWAELCVIRAGKFAIAPNSSQSSFGTDRNGPYYKLMDLAKNLREQYQEACEALNLTTYAGSGAVAQSEVTVESLDLGAQVPIEMSVVPPTPVLTSETAVAPDGAIIISWTVDTFRNFAKYIILHKTGADAIIQSWNLNSESGVPFTHNSASNVGELDSQQIKSAKLNELVATTGTVNRFVLAVVSRSGKISFSNEVAVTQP
jgi:hypothetical protein